MSRDVGIERPRTRREDSMPATSWKPLAKTPGQNAVA
jgi:hypothetical protein